MTINAAKALPVTWIGFPELVLINLILLEHNLSPLVFDNLTLIRLAYALLVLPILVSVILLIVRVIWAIREHIERHQEKD